MNSSSARTVDRLLALPRNAKKTLALSADCALCVLTVWLAICLRYENWLSLAGYQWLAVFISITLAIPLLIAFGFYHTVIRYVGKQTMAAALRAMFVYAVIYSAIFTAYGFPTVPRTIGVLQPILLLVGLAFVRLFASQLLTDHTHPPESKELTPSVLIYGAGISGQQLATSLQTSKKSRIIGFLDDDINLQKAHIAGIPVYSPNSMEQLLSKHPVRDVLLAMPSLPRSKKNEIIRLLGRHRLAIRTLPSLSDLAHGNITEDQLRELDIEDLLGRDPVTPIDHLLRKNIAGKVVLITGAGGSIGSELSRQVLHLKPTKLIVIDLNEYALYTIIEQLQPIAKQLGIDIQAVLANVQDANQILQLFELYKPTTVYHAAAYKHVPLVESNPIAGLRNNVLGTFNVALACLSTNVQDMVLISTDKAVRPTNIMGASKRISEMVLQTLADANRSELNSTRFCMVRFGNVLASSGSVIPKFREQIRSGGPITVTHTDVTRYFMTIAEAAQLVLQASAMDHGGSHDAQVFLLDMGKSVKIIDLAKALIHLSGMTIRDEANPDGDITIVTTGLRPGEKLYEELLIAGEPLQTEHPKIMKSYDTYPTLEKINKLVNLLKTSACINTDAIQASQLFEDLNTGYSTSQTD